MKIKIIIIGLALALMLCISPVAAVSGNDFEIVEDWSGDIPTYKYYNKYTPGERYINLYTEGTCLMSGKLNITVVPTHYPDRTGIT